MTMKLLIVFAVICVTSAQQEFCLSDNALSVLNDITTTTTEQKNLISTICNSLESNQREYRLVTIQQCVSVNSDKTLQQLCSEGLQKGYVMWITWQTYAEHVRKWLVFNDTEVPILTMTNFTTPYKIEYDQTSNSSQVLVEVLPIRYEIRNATVTNKRIIKYIRQQILGSQTKIENVSNYPQILNGSITYGFEGKINLKFSDEYGIFGLPVHIVDDETGELHDFSFGIERNYTEILVNEFSKAVPANTTLNVSLEGKWTITEFDVAGLLQPIYGINGPRLSIAFTAKALTTQVTNVSRKYDDGTGSASIVTTLIPTLVYDVPYLASPDELVQRKRMNTVYPEFRPYFHLACLILFGTIFVIAADIARQLFNDRKVYNTKLHYDDYRKYIFLDANMTRRFCVCGNFKMNGSKAKITDICKRIAADRMLDTNTELVLALPAPYIPLARLMLPLSVGVAGQNCNNMSSGAYTGEISAGMLADCGAQWLIVGHSERRRLFAETDELIAEKVAIALAEGLKVIACIGETVQERENGITNEVVCRQCNALATGIKDWENVLIAYEPSTILKAEQAQKVHSRLRKWLADNISAAVSAVTRILYGGFVTVAICEELAEQPDIDGFLIGELCLEAEFLKVVNIKT